MSFLIDPPWLYATGEAYARLAPERLHRRPGAATHAVSAVLFATSPLRLVLGYRRGRR